MVILAWKFKSVADDDSDKHTLFKCWEKKERFYADLSKTRTQYDVQFSQNTLADINI